MLRITVGSLAFVGAIIGGVAIVKVGPIVGPFNFHQESPLLSEDDEQRARALRIAAERKAERAAEKRVQAETEAEEAARQRKLRNDMAIKTEFGEVYAFLCKTREAIFQAMKDPMFVECLSKTVDMKCPHPRSESLGTNDWSLRYRDEGWLFFC